MPKETNRKVKVTRLETNEELEAKIVKGVKRERLKDLRALTEALRSSN